MPLFDFTPRDRPAGISQSIHSSIEVDSCALSYTPGDVIRGVIKRICTSDPHNQEPPVTVVINLVVRIETRITQRKGSGDNERTYHYKGERDLYVLRETVFCGPVKYGINTWPFSVVVPATTAPSTSFLSFPSPSSSSSSLDTLPPSIYRRRENVVQARTIRDYVFVEYKLEAQVFLAAEGRKGKGIVQTAVFPIFVRPKSSPTPIPRVTAKGPRGGGPDPQPLSVYYRHLVKSHHLDPSVGASGHKSFRQHMETVFQRGKLPRFAFVLVVDVQPHLQLGGANGPLSFRVRAVPVRDDPEVTSEALAKSKRAPRVNLVAVELRLRTATHVDALEGRDKTVTELSEGRWESRYLLDWRVADGKKLRSSGTAAGGAARGKGQRKAVRVSGDDENSQYMDEKKAKGKENKGADEYDNKQEKGKAEHDNNDESDDEDDDDDTAEDDPNAVQLFEDRAFDLCENTSLIVTPTGTLFRNSPHQHFDDVVYPTIRSRHITHIHELKWHITVSCAGKKLKCEGKVPVEVLGPSEDVEKWRERVIGVQGVEGAHKMWAEGRLPTPTVTAVPRTLDQTRQASVSGEAAAAAAMGGMSLEENGRSKREEAEAERKAAFAASQGMGGGGGAGSSSMQAGGGGGSTSSSWAQPPGMMPSSGARAADDEAPPPPYEPAPGYDGR